jgi:1,3-beta-glucan synthase
MVLSREFKHDETNRAWWTGRWYGRGLGAHVMSQPAREFVVKIIELSLWSCDLILGHVLLFILTPPVLVPYFDRIHATLLCMYSRQLIWGYALTQNTIITVWLRPSKQIRAPLYSIKQRRQRRSIVREV